MNRRLPSHLRLHTEENFAPSEIPAQKSEKANVEKSKSIKSDAVGKPLDTSIDQTSVQSPSSNRATSSKGRASNRRNDPSESIERIADEELVKRPRTIPTPQEESSSESTVSGPTPARDKSPSSDLDDVAACLRSFAQATGWAVRSTAPRSYTSDGDSATARNDYLEKRSSKTYSDSSASSQHSQRRNRWRLVDAAPLDGVLSASDLDFFPTVTLEHAEKLLGSIERLVDRLEDAEQALRRQEAELATGVSVTRRPDEQEELADRLETVLASAAKSIQASASAIYLLDETTSELKLRSCWGLPMQRLADPPRSLRGSLGDLEALMGNAVLLEDTLAMPGWKSPEDFPSALVVPIGSSSMPHGTVWFWSDKVRKYAMTEIEIANLAAGRVMSELEHTILGKEVQNAKRLQQQMNRAANAQAARLPDRQALHRDYDFDGWTFQGDALGGGFHDWDLTPSLAMVACVGSAAKSGPEGALIATAIQSTFRTLWPTKLIPSQMMQSAANMLFGIQPSDWTASAALFQINPETGYGMLAAAGAVQAFIISQRGFRPIGCTAPALASQPDALYRNHRFMLQPQEVLVAFSDAVVRSPQLMPSSRTANDVRPSSQRDRNQAARQRRALTKSLDQNVLLQSVRERINESASDIAGHLARMLPSILPNDPSPIDRSLIVIRNKCKL